MTKKQKKLKRVAYRFIPRGSEGGAPLYRLLEELVDLHHAGLGDARIGLMWHLAWKPDVDGRVTLGQCKRASDFERELLDERGQPFDFVIILRQEFWTDPLVTDLQRKALLDHELCHAAVAIGLDGEPLVDERQRTVYRLRKHDLEEFACIADRYGCWKKDLEAFAQALDRGRHLPRDRWVGFTTLQQELRVVGVVVPVTVVATWTDDERREASTWALLRAEFPLVAESMPTHLVTATRSLEA